MTGDSGRRAGEKQRTRQPAARASPAKNSVSGLAPRFFISGNKPHPSHIPLFFPQSADIYFSIEEKSHIISVTEPKKDGRKET